MANINYHQARQQNGAVGARQTLIGSGTAAASESTTFTTPCHLQMNGGDFFANGHPRSAAATPTRTDGAPKGIHRIFAVRAPAMMSAAAAECGK